MQFWAYHRFAHSLSMVLLASLGGGVGSHERISTSLSQNGPIGEEWDQNGCMNKLIEHSRRCTAA